MTHAGMTIRPIIHEHCCGVRDIGVYRGNSYDDLQNLFAPVGMIILTFSGSAMLQIIYQYTPEENYDLLSITHHVFYGIEEFSIKMFLHLLFRQPHEVLPSKLVPFKVGLTSHYSALHKKCLFNRRPW